MKVVDLHDDICKEVNVTQPVGFVVADSVQLLELGGARIDELQMS